MAISYQLRAQYVGVYGGGSVSYGPYGNTFNVGAALTAGSGTITTSDATLANVLDDYPPLFRSSTDGLPLIPGLAERFKSVSVGNQVNTNEVAFEVHRSNELYARLQILGDGSVNQGSGSAPLVNVINPINVASPTDVPSVYELSTEVLDADRRIVDAITVTFNGAPGTGSHFLWSDGSLGTWRTTLIYTLNFVDYIDGFTITYRPRVLTPGDRTAWVPRNGTSFHPVSDTAAAALVTRIPEVRAENVGSNNYVPSDSELAAFHAARNLASSTENPYTVYVTGRPGMTSPTTNELIQWVSHKWGIPTDHVRAQMDKESRWSMTALGDLTTEPDSSYVTAAPPQARATGLNVYESLGISQIRWFPDKSGNPNPHPGTEPLRWKSTAFNLDYYGSVVRFYYDDPGGHRTAWGDVTYSPGDPWKSLGGWYLPYPWGNTGMTDYAADVQVRLAGTPWLIADFSNIAADIQVFRQPNITRGTFGAILNRPRPTVEAYVAPTIPGAPTGLTILAANAALNLTWTAPVSDGGSPLVSYRLTEVNEGWQVDTGGTNVQPFHLTGLTNGHSQTFTIAAVNGVGYSAESASASGTPTAPPPRTVPPLMPDRALSAPATSSSESFFPASRAVDGDPSTAWRSVTVPTLLAPQWMAVNINSVSNANKTSIWAVLKNHSQPRYQPAPATLGSGGNSFNTLARNYVLQAHASTSSTCPADSDSGWVDLVTVTDNRRASRVHTGLNLSGYGWFKVLVTEASGAAAANDDVSIQLELRDVQAGVGDSILVYGDSISMEGVGFQSPGSVAWRDSGVQQVIATAASRTSQAVITDYSTGGWTTFEGDSNKSDYLGGMPHKIWLLAFGHNDAHGAGVDLNSLSPAGVNSTYAQGFKTRLQSLVDYALAQGAGRVIIPTIPWTNNGTFDEPNVLILNTIIGQIVAANTATVQAGPDQFTYFNAHQNTIRDGIHPGYDPAVTGQLDGGSTGYEKLHALWGTWFAANVYT